MKERRGFFTGRLRRVHGSVSTTNQELVSPIGIFSGSKDRPMQSGREKKSERGFRGSEIFYDRTTHK